jgi:hypothetical protein
MSGRADPPARPDAPAGAVRPGRRWLPVWAVTGILVVTVLGGFVTASALPAPEVPNVAVGSLRVRPPPGWAVVRRDRVTLSTSGGRTIAGSFAQLSSGSGALDLLAVEGIGGDVDDAARFYTEEVLRRQLHRLHPSALDHVVLRSGLPAVRFAYIGTEPQAGAAIEGAVTVVVGSSGTTAIFDGWSFEGQLELIADELERTIDTAEVG